MEEVILIEAKEEYIDSYWDAFYSIAKEKEFFSFTNIKEKKKITDYLKKSIDKNYPTLFLIDKKEDKVVGFINAQEKCKGIGYVGMGIIKEYRGIGLGKKALKRLLELSEAFGYKVLELDVRKENIVAINLYESLNFKIFNVIRNGIRIEGKNYDIIKMEYKFK